MYIVQVATYRSHSCDGIPCCYNSLGSQRRLAQPTTRFTMQVRAGAFNERTAALPLCTGIFAFYSNTNVLLPPSIPSNVCSPTGCPIHGSPKHFPLLFTLIIIPSHKWCHSLETRAHCSLHFQKVLTVSSDFNSP